MAVGLIPLTMPTALPPTPRPSPRSSIGYACLAVVLAVLWQFLTVHYNFEGNATALYLTSQRLTVPEGLDGEIIYRFPNTLGYDGQFYHYIAHDPFFREGFATHVDDARLRYRRILVPGLAFLLAFGQSDDVDAAYRVTILSFLFLGVYWLSRYAAREGRNPGWGLFFCVIPAAAISVERLTIDIALAALCAGYAFYALTRQESKLTAILILAPFARETGLGLVLAHACHQAFRRRWKSVVLPAVTTLPFLGWAAFVSFHTPPSLSRWSSFVPLAGLMNRSVNLFPSGSSGAKEMVAASLDYAGIAGVWLAFVVLARLLHQKYRAGASHELKAEESDRSASRPLRLRAARTLLLEVGPLETAATVFALMAVFLYSPEVWFSAYSFGRVLSPWFVFLAIAGLPDQSRLALVPAILILPRIAAQYGTQLAGIVAKVLSS